MSNNSVISSTGTKIDGITVCDSLSPKYANNEPYLKSIAAITRYSYNKSTKETKFIINYSYSGDHRTLKYTIATLNGKNFVVSTDAKDMFTVKLPEMKNTDENGEYIINEDGNYEYTVKAYSSLTEQEKQNIIGTPYYDNNFTNSYAMKIDMQNTLYQFEIESLAFVTKSADK